MNYRNLVLKNLGLAWILLLVAISLMVLEANLNYPWIKITNGLWLVSIIGLALFTARGFYYLWKHLLQR